MNSHDYDKPVIEAVKKVSPAVVSIAISKSLPRMHSAMPFFNPFLPFGDIEDGAKEKVKVGGGAGFLVAEDGIVLTNKHVVIDEDAEYAVVTSSGKEYSAKVLSRDPIKDIAILKIDAKHLPTVELGD